MGRFRLAEIGSVWSNCDEGQGESYSNRKREGPQRDPPKKGAIAVAAEEKEAAH